MTEALRVPLGRDGGVGVEVEASGVVLRSDHAVFEGVSRTAMVMSLVGDRGASGWWMLDGGFAALCVERRLGAPLSLAVRRALREEGGALTALEQRTLAPLMTGWLTAIEPCWRGAARIWAPAESASVAEGLGQSERTLFARHWCVMRWNLTSSARVDGVLQLAMDDAASQRVWRSDVRT